MSLVRFGLVVAMMTGAGVALAQSGARMSAADFQTMVWASSCMACHGPQGHSSGNGLTLGGRPAEELYQMLLDFKSGRRSATVMHQHARGYSEEELRRIATHFSQLK